MSILSDLDPKKARFSDDSFSEKSKNKFWLVPMALFLAASVWLFYSNQFSQNSAAEDIPLISPTAHQNDSPARVGAVPPTSIAKSDPPPPPRPAGAGAAVILASAPPPGNSMTEKNTDGDVFQAMQLKPERARAEQPVAGQKQASKTRQEKRETKRKAVTVASDRKAPSKTVAIQNSSEATTRAAKKSAERDVDIISAIVR